MDVLESRNTVRKTIDVEINSDMRGRVNKRVGSRLRSVELPQTLLKLRTVMIHAKMNLNVQIQ